MIKLKPIAAWTTDAWLSAIVSAFLICISILLQNQNNVDTLDYVLALICAFFAGSNLYNFFKEIIIKDKA